MSATPISPSTAFSCSSVSLSNMAALPSRELALNNGERAFIVIGGAGVLRGLATADIDVDMISAGVLHHITDNVGCGVAYDANMARTVYRHGFVFLRLRVR